MSNPIKLYDMELSGNCYKIRLFCGLLGLPYQSIPVNLFQLEHKQAAYLQINPRGQLPAIDDNGTVIWDSSAILVYLARKYGDESWLGLQPEALANIMQWLALAENELLYGLARARATLLFKRPWNLAECQALGKQGLAVLEQHLQKNNWLAAEHPTIADVACYPYVALAPEGGLPLDELPNIQAWLARIQSLSGYIDMPGIKNYTNPN